MNSSNKNTPAQYAELKRPRWAPPSRLFGPVWTALYIIIFLTFGYTLYLYFESEISLFIVLPFILNIISNALYTPLQFGLRNRILATIDIFFVLGTLIWALAAIYPHASIVTYANIPYLLWVCFATVLQVTITTLNV